METWQKIGNTTKLASSLVTKFGVANLATIWILLEITEEIYNITIYDVNGFFQKALEVLSQGTQIFLLILGGILALFSLYGLFRLYKWCHLTPRKNGH
ncbi:hypothetical protein TNCV_4933941 [Trichonephila clavipes]|nr:hypothetical protein TNCV_4933941 [Trichonephila clavipes]